MNASAPAGRLPPTLVRLTPPAPGGTIVFMPDLGGSVFYARALVQEIGGAVGCLGTRLDRTRFPDLDGMTIPELGRRLAEDIARAGLPQPLCIAGFSFAGCVAFETVRRLAELGVQVDTLWVFDTEMLRGLPGFSMWRTAPFSEMRRVLGFVRRNWRVMLGGRPDPDVLHVFGAVPMYLKEHPKGMRDIIRALYPALTGYQPQPWSGPPPPRRTVMVRGVQEPRPRSFPDDLGWRQLIPRCEVVDVPGPHLGMMTDPAAVAQMAQAVRARLGPDRLGPDQLGTDRLGTDRQDDSHTSMKETRA